jgi:hypothetical protein
MKRSSNRITLANINPRFLPQIEAQLAMGRKASGLALPPETVAAPQERRIRQSAIKLNKLERDYLDVLNMRHGAENVFAQAVRVRLGNGLWFKPDFFIPSESLFIETKGPKSFRGGFENLKAAASVHKWAKFRLVWRVSGQWKFQEVLP